MSRRLFPATRPKYLSVCARSDADCALVLAFKAQAAAEGISTQALLLQICELYLASL